MNKGSLAIFLSKLKKTRVSKVELEQYETDSELASEILWYAFMQGDIKGKVIADLGCGNGILGCGCLKLGAKKVYFVEKDKETLEVARSNCKSKKAMFFLDDINNFNEKVDAVIMNPPFGVQEKHADKDFLKTRHHHFCS